MKKTVLPGSISVSGLPPGLSSLLDTSQKNQVFRYPTMLMLRILRKTQRSDSVPVKPKSAAQLATVQLQLDCPRVRERRTYSASRLKQVLKTKRPEPIPTPQCLPSEDCPEPDSPEAFRTALPTDIPTNRRTIFVRREGSVRYSYLDFP